MSSLRLKPSNMAFRFSSPLARAGGASVLLHALGLAVILFAIKRPIPLPAPAGPMVELRLVEFHGSEKLSQGGEQEPPRSSPDLLPEATSSDRLPAGPAREESPAVPPSSPEEAGKRSEGPPHLNVAGDSLTNALATGPAVVPARIDARWHNREPEYPLEAAQRREAGTVLLIHVGPDGAAESVDVARSSGFPLLDRAARAAVETWHFLPAVHDGQSLASDMPLRVVFQLN
jgi:protein TonB